MIRERLTRDPFTAESAGERASITSRAIIPACPWRSAATPDAMPQAAAAAAAATSASIPLARNAATTPVSTSPLPAVARPGLPRSTTTGLRPGPATSVSAPLRSTTVPVSSAPACTASSRLASTHAERRPSSRPSSPAWGVSTVGASREKTQSRWPGERPEPVGIEDDRLVEAVEQEADERTGAVGPAEAGAERDGARRSAASSISSAASTVSARPRPATASSSPRRALLEDEVRATPGRRR